MPEQRETTLHVNAAMIAVVAEILRIERQVDAVSLNDAADEIVAAVKRLGGGSIAERTSHAH